MGSELKLNQPGFYSKRRTFEPISAQNQKIFLDEKASIPDNTQLAILWTLTY